MAKGKPKKSSAAADKAKKSGEAGSDLSELQRKLAKSEGRTAATEGIVV